MTDSAEDQLGPIDYLVLEFPGSRFNGEIAPALFDLVDRGLVRVLDLVFIKKDGDGSVTAFELEELDEDEAGAFQRLAPGIADLVSDSDVEAVAEVVERGTSAAVVVWENLWAAPLANAVQRCGGEVVASGRIPVADLMAAVDTPLPDES